MNKTEEILRRITKRTEKVGPIRAFFIGIIFPEFGDICGDMADLCRHLKL